METKTSSTNPMTATDRRSFLQKVTAALGFMPLAGCALDKEGIPFNNLDDSQPFEGLPVGLRIASLRPAPPPGTTPLGNYTLEIYFEADVTGVGLRKHSQSFKDNQLQPLPFDVTDSFIIMLSESGPVSCKCKFIYDPPAPPLPEEYEATHQKLANEELPWFKLIFVDPGYELV